MHNSKLFDLEGKTALVTGGARGIGRMCAEALLDHGARVIITTRSSEAAQAARRELRTPSGKQCAAIVVDLSLPSGIARLSEDLHERLEKLDILVNNAGIAWGAPFGKYPPEAWTKVLQLDVATPFQVVQTNIDLLAAAGTAGEPARIVNVGSTDGQSVSSFDHFAYPAGKAALHHLTRMLAIRLAPDHVTVNCIAPGFVMTKMTAELLSQHPHVERENPLGRLANADDIAGALVYLTARSGAYVTGAVLPVDGGFAIPTWASRALSTKEAR